MEPKIDIILFIAESHEKYFLNTETPKDFINKKRPPLQGRGAASFMLGG
jgi:hypothetical protein